MTKTMVFKPEKCLGCRTCEIICSCWNEHEFNPQKSRVEVIEYEHALISVPVMCTQCEEAPCAKVCPVKAISRDERGAMIIDYNKCIVCKMCVSACPLGNMAFDGSKVFKCNLCEGKTMCARYCPTGAIEYDEATPTALGKRKEVAEKFKDAFGEEE